MAIIAGSMQEIGTGGHFITEGAGGSEPDPCDIAVARLSATSLRVTITNSDGTPTNYVLYAATSDGGDTWLDGGNRSGDGNVDIAGLTTGETYVVLVVSVSGGYNSYPSNRVEILLTADASSTPERWMGFPHLLEPPKVHKQTRDLTIYQYTYAMGVEMTLSDASLEVGDTIPEDSDYEIIQAERKKRSGTANEVAVVLATKDTLYA